VTTAELHTPTIGQAIHWQDRDTGRVAPGVVAGYFGGCGGFGFETGWGRGGAGGCGGKVGGFGKGFVGSAMISPRGHYLSLSLSRPALR
jgi:hypothetical protein